MGEGTAEMESGHRGSKGQAACTGESDCPPSSWQHPDKGREMREATDGRALQTRGCTNRATGAKGLCVLTWGGLEQVQQLEVATQDVRLVVSRAPSTADGQLSQVSPGPLDMVTVLPGEPRAALPVQVW